VDALLQALHDAMLAILQTGGDAAHDRLRRKTLVILVVGINGAGKTHDHRQLARRLLADGHSVMLAAGDTFPRGSPRTIGGLGRAQPGAHRPQQGGAEPRAVIFDGLQAARARNIDVLIATPRDVCTPRRT